jgi:uncharacterized protein (TIGR03435 family)
MRGVAKIHVVIAFLLAMVLALAIAPSIRAQSQQTAGASSSPSFEVASIKPSRSGDGRTRIMFSPDAFTVEGLSAKTLIGLAYNLRDFQISGGPGWIDSERYDINAKMDEPTIESLRKLPPEQAREQRRLMLQSLLAERFQLKVSQSSKELPIYALVVAKSGAKLSESAAPPAGSGPTGQRTMMRLEPGQLTATAISISALVDRLSLEVGRKVVDKTGLEGRYDFTLHWTPEQQAPLGGPGNGSEGAPPSSDSSGPSIFTALQEQLGLKLESAKGPVETIVIDRIERPSAN